MDCDMICIHTCSEVPPPVPNRLFLLDGRPQLGCSPVHDHRQHWRKPFGQMLETVAARHVGHLVGEHQNLKGYQKCKIQMKKDYRGETTERNEVQGDGLLDIGWISN